MSASSAGLVVRPSKAAELLDIGVSTLWRYTKTVDDFPKPVKINERVSVFVKAELEKWIEDRIAASRAQS